MNVDHPEFIDNPYRFYQKKRSRSPVMRAGGAAWSVTGYDPMARILANPSAGRGNVGWNPGLEPDAATRERVRAQNPALRILDDWMLFKNPPEHTRLRKLVLKAFTPAAVAAMEERMRSVMHRLIDDAAANGGREFDFVPAIAYPFPITVICEMIGIPPADRDRFRDWTRDFAYAVQLDFRALTPQTRRRLNRSAVALTDYFESLAASKRRSGDNDLVTRLVQGGDGDEALTQAEILANCVFLLFSGHETTTSLLCNGIDALLAHPEQRDLLWSDPGLAPAAVEESLRYDPPIQMVGRYALDDFDVGGHRFRRGDHLFLFLGAAGRDPLANTEPDVFDITRSDIRHLAFARGVHHCLGMSLARLEARVALEELGARLPGLQRAAPARRRRTWLMRGFDALPVRC